MARNISGLPRSGVKVVIAQIFEGTAVEGAGTALSLHFHRPRAIASILRAIIRCQHFKFGDGFEIGINVQRGVAAVIHVVAAVELPIVVFVAAAVHAIGHVAVHAHFALVRATLVHNTGRQSDELREIAAVQFEVVDLLASNYAGQIRGLRLYLRHALAGNRNFFAHGADRELHVNARLFRDVQFHILRGVFLKALCAYAEIIRTAGQTSDGVRAIAVGCGGAR